MKEQASSMARLSTKNTHAVWLVVDASDWPGHETDNPMDLEGGLGEQVGDTTGTGRVLAATTKTNQG